MKDVQATGEAFSPQKRKSSISKHEIFLTFFYFSGSYLTSWIRIQPTKTNADPCGTGSTTLVIFRIQDICCGSGSMPLTNGSGPGFGSRSKPLTNGSVSGRPKNMWIRIRNTDKRYIISQPDPRGAYPGSSVGRALSRHCGEPRHWPPAAPCSPAGLTCRI
jgi:hypothetical protein